MVKSVGAALLSDIQSNVTTLATCIEIIRKDGQVLRLTTHDTDLTIAGDVYIHDVSFNLAAIQSAAQLQVDNTTLTIFCDEVLVFLADFKAHLWEYAAITIFQVNYLDVTHGKVTMRKGWFGPIDLSQNRVVTITLTGLLKILDLDVGHLYQASCDADLGDHRCKIAVQQEQIYSHRNVYRLGDWVYYYDPALMTALTVTNPSFETDGTRTSGQAITGWTKTDGAAFQVRADGNGFGTFSAVLGTYMLCGATVLVSPYESGLSQVVDISTQIADDAAIDDGQISVGFFCALMVTEILSNRCRLKLELLDEDDVILDIHDTRYMTHDAIAVWRDRACVLPLTPGTRSVRLWIYFYTGFGGLHGGDAADDVRLYWWNHTVATPYNDVIHKVSRIGTFDVTQAGVYPMFNPSFEGALVSNADNPTIPAWVPGTVNTENVHVAGPNGHWWQIVANAFAGALTPQDGLHFLLGGDDGGALQRTYEISQVHSLTSVLTGFGITIGWQLDTARILLGKMAGQLKFLVGYGDTTSAATVILEWWDADDNVLDTLTFLSAATGTVGWHTITGDFVIPAMTDKVKVILKATSPVGSGNAKVAYDAIKFLIYDTERPAAADPRSGQGVSTTVFDTTIGSYTFNNGLIFKALAALTAYDTVDTVIGDRNEFTGFAIAGSAGTFETGFIRFLSGDNAGLRNIIRSWDPDTSTVKLYFRTPYPIQVGDRYYYVQACQRRFIEDCVLRYQNALNFRGFPYLPGAIQDPNAAFGDPAVVTVDGGGSDPIWTITPNTGPPGTVVTIKANIAAFNLLPQLFYSFYFGIVPVNGFAVIGTGWALESLGEARLIAPGHAPGAVDIKVYFNDVLQYTVGTFTYT